MKRSIENKSSKNSFFDPEPPTPPEQVLGMPTEPLLNLVEAADKLALASPYFAGKTNIFKAKRHGEHVLSLFPLLVRVQAGEQLQPEDVRPYRKSIKKTVPKLNAIDKLAAASGLRTKLNNKIETDFIKHAPDVLQRVQEEGQLYLPQIEAEVDFLAGFENPRQEFVSEVSLVTDAIRERSREYSKAQGHMEVTAEDAGYGINQELGRLMLKKDKSLPLFTHFILDRIASNIEPPDKKLVSIVAPEIMHLLEAALPKNERDAQFIAGLERHPYTMRRTANLFKGSKLRWLDQGRPLLSTIGDLLPDTGQEVKDRFERIKNFLGVPVG